MAWLNATPKPDPGTRRSEERFKRPEVSRLEQLKRDRIPVPLPPKPMPVIIDRLMEIGLTEAAGMGAAPLSWSTIDAWQRVTGVAMPAWEARLIRHLSVAYLTESRQAESENCPPPWHAEVSQRERDIEQARLEALLG